MLKVSRMSTEQPEVFLSIQGEGISQGTQSIFLRLALCNLACTWCDTKYTWDWNQHDYHKEVMELSSEQVSQYISKYACNHIVITGGEPLIQKRALEPLVRSLKALGYSFEVETNGTILPGTFLEQTVDQWNVSPKLANSRNGLTLRNIPKALDRFSQLPNAYFKFVITALDDIEEVQTLIRNYQMPKNRVILMPEGTNAEDINEKGKWIAQRCIDEGYRFTTRLHIILWGDNRGK